MELRSPESIKEARWVWWITCNLSAKEGVDTEMPEQATTQTSKMSISKFSKRPISMQKVESNGRGYRSTLSLDKNMHTFAHATVHTFLRHT